MSTAGAASSNAHPHFLPVVSNPVVTRCVTPIALPTMTGRWLQQAVDGRTIPAETRATCDSCPMLPSPQGWAAVGGRAFNPETKCCTYVPTLANFLVGAILLDEDEAAAFGRRTLDERIAGKVGVTPLGVETPALYRAIYELGHTSGGFGTSERLLCPHYDQGRCGIWRHRNAICSTWFCKYERDSIGKNFWECARGLLEAMERTVSLWCVLQLAPGIDALRSLAAPKPQHVTQLTAQDIEAVVDAATYRLAWGSWVEREREFYTACARLAADLDWPAVLRIGGPELAVLQQVLTDHHAALLLEDIPSRLSLCKYQVVWATADVCRLAGQGFNHLDVPSWVPGVLHRFDGRPTEVVLADIAAETGCSVGNSLLRSLVDFKVLVASS